MLSLMNQPTRFLFKCINRSQIWMQLYLLMAWQMSGAHSKRQFLVSVPPLVWKPFAGLGRVSLLHPVPSLHTLFDSLVFYVGPKLLRKTVLFSAGLTIAILKSCLSMLHFTAC